MKEFTLKFYTENNSRHVACEELSIYEFGPTFKSAMKDFGETLDTLIAHYGMCPDKRLTKEAIELKELMLELIDDRLIESD